MAYRFRFERLELKFGWCAGAAARPHTRPLALSRWGLLFAAFTARVVHSGAKCTRKSETRAAASVAS